MKPLLKWIGETKIIEFYISPLPKNINNYHSYLLVGVVFY